MRSALAHLKRFLHDLPSFFEGLGSELIEMLHLVSDRGRICHGSTSSFKSLAA